MTPYTPEEFKKKAYELGDLVLHEGAMYKRTANGGVKKDWASSDWTMIRCAGGGIGQALSAGAVRDEYYEDHCVIRVGSEDLGTRNWILRIDSVFQNSELTSKMKGAHNIICAKYISGTHKDGGLQFNEDKAIQGYLADARVFVKDTSYTDVAAFKTAMRGVILYYELAEPITIYYDKKDFDYFADDYGTEGWIPQTGSTPRFVPPYMDITYGINVVDEVRQLPAKYFESKQFTQSNVTELFKENKEVSNQMLANLGSNLETVYGDGTDPNRLMGFELAMGFDENGEEKSVTFGIISDEWINQNLN